MSYRSKIATRYLWINVMGLAVWAILSVWAMVVAVGMMS